MSCPRHWRSCTTTSRGSSRAAPAGRRAEGEHGSRAGFHPVAPRIRDWLDRRDGKVLVLVHDGKAIWESAAITLYLGEIFGVAEGLYPEPGPERGEAMKWVVWSNVTLGDAFGRLVRNTSDWVPAEQHNAKAA